MYNGSQSQYVPQAPQMVPGQLPQPQGQGQISQPQMAQVPQGQMTQVPQAPMQQLQGQIPQGQPTQIPQGQMSQISQGQGQVLPGSQGQMLGQQQTQNFSSASSQDYNNRWVPLDLYRLHGFVLKIIEPHHEKTCVWICEQQRHRSACASVQSD